MTEPEQYWQHNNFIQELLKQLPVHVFWKDVNSVYLGCNEIFAKSLGLSSPEEIIGKTDFDLPTTLEESKAFRQDDKAVMEKRQPKLNIEEHQTLSDGRQITLLTSKVPLFDSTGSLMGILGVYSDITDKKRAEKLEVEKEKAEKNEQHVKIAAGHIAHDLRTPLSSIRFAMRAIEDLLPKLLDSYQIAKEHHLSITPIRATKISNCYYALERCQKEIDFANNYIDMILNNLKYNYNHINTSNYELNNIIKLVNYSLDSYPYQNDEKELVCWEPTVDFNFWGHELYFKNIINNLLKNSFFYIKKCQHGQIFITTEKSESHYILIFKDTAQGAPPEIVKHMFDGYFSKREGGTGLGLAFCKSIMQSFKGDIIAESVEGKFMKFILTFPILEEPN